MTVFEPITLGYDTHYQIKGRLSAQAYDTCELLVSPQMEYIKPQNVVFFIGLRHKMPM